MHNVLVLFLNGFTVFVIKLTEGNIAIRLIQSHSATVSLMLF